MMSKEYDTHWPQILLKNLVVVRKVARIQIFRIIFSCPFSSIDKGMGRNLHISEVLLAGDSPCYDSPFLEYCY